MFMRRSPFRLVFLVGLGVLLGAVLVGGGGSLDTLILAPFVVLGFLFKIALFVLLFGFIAKAFGGHRGRSWKHGSPEKWAEEMHRKWERHTGSTESDERPEKEDRFEEWHRMAHARQEIDDHVPPVED